jgi:hypothetical protein
MRNDLDIAFGFIAESPATLDKGSAAETLLSTVDRTRCVWDESRPSEKPRTRRPEKGGSEAKEDFRLL